MRSREVARRWTCVFSPEEKCTLFHFALRTEITIHSKIQLALILRDRTNVRIHYRIIEVQILTCCGKVSSSSPHPFDIESLYSALELVKESITHRPLSRTTHQNHAGVCYGVMQDKIVTDQKTRFVFGLGLTLAPLEIQR